ncbi:HNH endonuclease [Ruegeria arenilitoris]|uniref:HNH endonuclease n=1 Tax=Ruegeria arenilitoris TaxID=1173585 RepID=UPI001C2BF92D|nr:HNH endonuclease signature motif containing protein [Ruegeria arenilitoris]
MEYSDQPPEFDFTHGPTEAERRAPSVFRNAVSDALKRPTKGGRKVLAMFEAQNPNGLVARWQRENGDLPETGAIREATDFLKKYGGRNCVRSWPTVTDLNDAIGVLEAALGDEPTEVKDVHWSDDELKACLIAYLEMLGKEMSGIDYSKSETNQILRDGPLKDRSKSSVEYRMQNLSAFFQEQGLPTIDGYKPAGNVGPSVLERLIRLHVEIGQVDPSDFAPSVDERTTRERSSRLRKAVREHVPAGNANPSRTERFGSSYVRDPAVVAWVLEQANGKCELCDADAPFLTPIGEPFLEVHHVTYLGKNGPDTTSNAAALCPNCHRKCHNSEDPELVRLELVQRIPRLTDHGSVAGA